VPEKLTPPELYNLSLAYFRKQEFEKAAVLLDHLLTLSEEPRYQRAENYLLSGISWYHLKNFVLARKQIGQAMKYSQKDLEVHRQAMLWDALVEKTQGHEKLAQTKLLNFIGAYPHAEESGWINGGRKPAREGREFFYHGEREVKEAKEGSETHASGNERHNDSEHESKKEEHHEGE
jgi:tetratricopeptide (TPR) repeat protein